MTQIYALAKSLISLLPPGRRFLAHHAAMAAALRTPDSRTATALESQSTHATAREIQRAAANHLPLLPGDLKIEGTQHFDVRGLALASNGLTNSLSFFLNGRPFDSVTYPVHDDHTRALFSEIDGAAGFLARMNNDVQSLINTRLFRMDISRTGAQVHADWRRAAWFMNPSHEPFPMPPAVNMKRVIGDTNTFRFGMGGITIQKKIESYLYEMGSTWDDFPRILDWGCGAGRITRYLISETKNTIHGADIDDQNISWCTRNLTSGEFTHLALTPPTPFPTGYFNLIIGASVMTHLTEDMQFAWLKELQRITQPGALLFLSTAGPVQFAYLGIPPLLYQRVEKEGFVDAARDPALDGYIGDMEYYRSTWHSRPYIVEHWGRYFDVLDIVDGVAALQDFVVLRRRNTV